MAKPDRVYLTHEGSFIHAFTCTHTFRLICTHTHIPIQMHTLIDIHTQAHIYNIHSMYTLIQAYIYRYKCKDRYVHIHMKTYM